MKPFQLFKWKRSLLILLVFVTSNLYAADYYWIGGSGNWSDLNHWRLGSTGGSIPSIVPSTADNVFFTAGSGFTSASKTVTLNTNGFCNNIDWTGVTNNPIFSTTNAALTVEVWGNMVLSAGTAYNCIFNFKGAAPATITSNGTVSGAFGMEIDKPGSSLTVVDSLIVPYGVVASTTAYLTFTAGTFNIAGKKLSHLRFVSNNSNTRVLEMTNATVTFPYYYEYRGTNKVVNAGGSVLNALGYILTDGGTYNQVFNDAGSGSTNQVISNTTFSSLSFRWPSPGSYAGIDNGNTVIDSLVFAGQGVILGNNTVGSIRFGMLGSIAGTGNNIRKIRNMDNFQITGNFTNTVDSIILAPNRTTTFDGTLNINKYLAVTGAACDAYTEIIGDSISGSVNFAAGAVVTLNNAIITGVKAFGPVTPIAVNGIDGGENAGFTITEPVAAGTTFYWVGGSGDWNDRTHWSAASGGAGGACVPFKSDNVVFDANSGLTTGTVTTSSSSFCNNMTWTGVGNVIFNESTVSPFKMYGSLVMDNSVTINGYIEMSGTANASITTNGTTIGAMQFMIKKTGSGVVTFADNWINTTGGSITHYSGGLNLSGRTLSLVYFGSYLNAARSLDISNATITCTQYWDYRGFGKTLNAAGSHVSSGGGFGTDNQNYPWVDITGTVGAGIGFPISSTTFGQLTFTNTLTLPGAVNAGTNNTIRRLEFKSHGAVGGNDIIDSLILAGSKNYTIGNFTLNKYLKATATPCNGLTEMRGPGTITFIAGAVVDMANIYMQNVTATGPMTPIAFNGADAGGNSGWTITVAAGSPRYWIGGSGDWNDNTHWSAISGGAGGACIPTVFDNAYFDANSGFTAVSKTVTINNGNAYCYNVNWTGAANSPVWSKSASWNLEAWGDSIIVIATATFNVSPLTAKGSNSTYLQGNAPLGNFDITIDKPGGSLTLLNDYNNANTDIVPLNGSFNASGRTLNISTFTNLDLVNTTSINISNANITTGGWRYSNSTTNHTLNAANSVINTGGFAATGLTYNKVNVSGTTNAQALLAGTTIDSLTFTNTSTSSAVGINGANNNLNYVEYKGSGGIYGTGNTIDTLVFFPGKIYTLTAGTNTTITGEWFASGTPCSLTEIVSSSAAANATVTKTGSNIDFDYIRLRRITAAGPAVPFNARNHTDNQGNNINWTIAPYNGAAPIYGLGPDIAVAPASYPIVLHTDGFFGSPSSQYTWNNGSTADSLIITGPGTYSVTVFFPDGCSISDNIVVTNAVVVPVTLSDFTGTAKGCNVQLNWKAEAADNFSRFVIERSGNGRDFEAIGTVSENGAAAYSYEDIEPGTGNWKYRLKLIDKDGSYAYSAVISVKLNCALNETLVVYPNPVTDRLYIKSSKAVKNITLFSVTGSLISSKAYNQSQPGVISMPVAANLAKGTYILQVTSTDGTIQNSKMIKE